MREQGLIQEEPGYLGEAEEAWGQLGERKRMVSVGLG